MCRFVTLSQGIWEELWALRADLLPLQAEVVDGALEGQ